MQFEITKDYLEQFRGALDNHNESLILSLTEGLHAADIKAVLEHFDSEESKFVFDLLEPGVAADIISDLEEPRVRFLKEFSSEEIAVFLEHIDSDDAADILFEQPIQTREEVINQLASHNPEKAENIKELLHYEEDTAGGLMAKELVKVHLSQSVKECKEEIRTNSERLRKLFTVYVVDENNVLVGRVSLRNLLLASNDTPISEIYIDKIFSVKTYMDDEEVAEIMQKYDLETIPVVDVYGRLQGRITIDDIVDVITEQDERDKQLMSGISEDIEENSSVWMLTRARLPWLLIGILGGMLGAYLIGFFEKDLALIPSMAFFIPLIMATGGNVGIQSSTIVVQSLATKSLKDQTWSRTWKGFLVAILNGLIIGILVLSANLIFTEDVKLAWVVSIALVFVVLLASLAGTLTPLLLDRVGVNPALASGPFITTSIDLLGIAVYFLVAHQLYNL